MISTPCIKICVMEGGLCTGCGRTLPEIARWGAMPEPERRAIMAALPARLASHAKDQAHAKAQADQDQKDPKGDFEPRRVHEWASRAPKGAINTAEGATSTKAISDTKPSEPGGRPALPSPART